MRSKEIVVCDAIVRSDVQRIAGIYGGYIERCVGEDAAHRFGCP
jgi:hypothetical protein